MDPQNAREEILYYGLIAPIAASREVEVELDCWQRVYRALLVPRRLIRLASNLCSAQLTVPIWIWEQGEVAGSWQR